jgi:hypothetical protein
MPFPHKVDQVPRQSLAAVRSLGRFVLVFVVSLLKRRAFVGYVSSQQ